MRYPQAPSEKTWQYSHQPGKALFGEGAFGGVEIADAVGAGVDQDSRLEFAEAFDGDGVMTVAVKPEHVDLAIVAQQFFNLAFDVGAIPGVPSGWVSAAVRRGGDGY